MKARLFTACLSLMCLTISLHGQTSQTSQDDNYNPVYKRGETVLEFTYITDYLGSVRSVMDATDGTVYEAIHYSAFGEPYYETFSALPDNITLRDHFTGCEDLSEYNYPYADHTARYYYTLQRWMAPDPLSEKYYGISPYAYCKVDFPEEFSRTTRGIPTMGR